MMMMTYLRVPNTVCRPYGKEVKRKKYWSAFQEIVLSVGGRPHWAKDFQLTLDQLGTIHSGWTRFVEVRNQLDQDRMFTNDKIKRVLGQ